MKAKFTALASLLLMFLMTLSFGQKGVEDGSQYGHGEDSVKCLRNFSLYREYARFDNYKDAYPYWKICFTECPLVSKNLYIDGAKMLKDKVEAADTPEKMQVYIDSLMLVYEQRIKYYPRDEGRVLGYMGLDLLRYQRDDVSIVEKANDLLRRSVQMTKGGSSAPVMATLMTSTITLFQLSKLTAEKVVEDYALVAEVVDHAIARDPDDKDLRNVKEYNDQNFAASGAANCDALVGLFRPQYEKNKNNAEFLKKVTDLLANTGCTDRELYRNTAESLHKLEPSAVSAYNMARLFREVKQYGKAAGYYKQAIELQTDPVTRSKYYVELADITFHEMNDLPLAREYTRKAAQDNPVNGQAYILTGYIIASTKNCGENDLEKKSVYWLAVDYFVKARQVDATLEEVCNKLIADYTQLFPDVETIFFHGLKEGDSYTIECWINETTRVRSR